MAVACSQNAGASFTVISLHICLSLLCFPPVMQKNGEDMRDLYVHQKLGVDNSWRKGGNKLNVCIINQAQFWWDASSVA